MKSSEITDKEQLPMILNSKQMSALLGCDIKTLSHFLRANPSCPHFRMGSRGIIKAPRDALLDWLNRFSKPKDEAATA